jgi:pimeloyl-ACP methyl ester carboxylesterase
MRDSKRQLFLAMSSVLMMLLVSGNVARASAELHVLSPFRLGAPDLTDLDLRELVPPLGNLSSARAQGLVADSTSTVIALFETSTRAAVTFTTDNGTSLAEYRRNFLTKAPKHGPQTLVVAASDLIRIGGKFYAPALVQAPARNKARSLDEPVVITATQEGTSDPPSESSLDLKIPPVLLIHGLWGDRASLSTTYNYLSNHSPWDEDQSLLSRVEYPKNLRFDADTIKATVADGVEALLAALDSKRIVGGRVDVVAHSMGGLVARDYASLAIYRAPRDRGQGQFHSVATLDTPGLGSELARFLIDHRNDDADAPPFSEPSLVWLAACGSLTVTVAECFEENNLPILGPTGLVRGGAVWSLIPGSGSLNHAPPFPSIAGLIWADITSVVRDQDDSELRYIVSNLIAATFSDPDSAPTPTDILGGANDVIVSLESQAEGSTRKNRIRFLGLDHSALRFEGFEVNEAVNNTNKVNDYVACWLETEGDEDCIPPGPVARPIERVAQNTPRTVPRIVDQLVRVPQDAQLGVPLSVTGIVDAKGVRRVTVYQKNDSGRAAPPEAEQSSPFRLSGNSLSFEIIPRLPGRVTFEILITLADGSKLLQRVVRKVTVRPDMLRELHGHGSDRVFLFMQLGGRLPLAPYGVFRNVAEDVPLDGMVDFAAETSGGPPVVRIEGDELVPLRPGTVRVVARLGSRSDLLTVTVKP